MYDCMIELIIYGLATWRVSSLLVNEAGPGNVFLRLRGLIGIEHDEGGMVTVIPDGFLPGVFSCVWCCSLWVGLGWMVAGWTAPVIGLKLATAFSFSAGAIVVQRWLETRR